MSNSFCASRPSFSASTNASDTAIIDTPRIMLLQIFAAWPLPGPPACTMVLPIVSRIGLARAKAASLPPTMKVSVPACAPPTPPDTGASSMARPFGSAAAATARAVSTSMVEQSISSVPGAGGGDHAVGAEIDLAHLLAGGQHGDHDFGAGRRGLRRRSAACRRRAASFSTCALLDIEACDRVSGLDQVRAPSAGPCCRAR